MDQLVINGRRRLTGEVSINGAKNAAVAVIPAVICSNSVCTIDNLPCIEDVSCLVEALTEMGAVCEFKDEHTLTIDSRSIKDCCAEGESIRKMRASYYLLGALLGRFKKGIVTLPGGCNFGTRPIDQHKKGFEALGAKVSVEHGRIVAEAERLIGADICLDVASVGATINIMLAAVYAEGVTTIENAAKEPHIVDTANFLNMLGARIKGAGTDIIRITGVNEMHGADYTIIPDQIEAGTYMIAGAITGGDITVKNIIPKHMDTLTAKLHEMQCTIIEGDDFIRVKADNKLKASNVKTMAYPGFPTDLQPQIASLLCVAEGNSTVTENVFGENRFQYTSELRRLGAEIYSEGRIAMIKGSCNLTGAMVHATDLRAGAALVIAGLAAEGTTTISSTKYIDRGYEAIEMKLQKMGADIKRVDVKDTVKGGLHGC